jgi:hypothetical protein
MKTPIWIIMDGGDTFEGHQGHFRDCFFSNANLPVIQGFCKDQGIYLETRDMTPEELEKYPEAVSISEELNETFP